jgi:hypothetical protein
VHRRHGPHRREVRHQRHDHGLHRAVLDERQRALRGQRLDKKAGGPAGSYAPQRRSATTASRPTLMMPFAGADARRAAARRRRSTSRS